MATEGLVEKYEHIDTIIPWICVAPTLLSIAKMINSLLLVNIYLKSDGTNYARQVL